MMPFINYVRNWGEGTGGVKFPIQLHAIGGRGGGPDSIKIAYVINGSPHIHYYNYSEMAYSLSRDRHGHVLSISDQRGVAVSQRVGRPEGCGQRSEAGDM